ncbi:MAG: hypothetical protein H6577_00315 [Lewinellaceae bacterium]|nr:hypothetical protein [Saprospiraceae bacterium]MCB9336552.1 hypothetical protein [Lewinellaceae bacterium]
MFKRFTISLSFVVLAFWPSHLSAQQKFEKESRLKEKDIPSNALGYMDALAAGKKIRWYLEEGIDRTSIEAKFKFNNQKYSVEFDTSGHLEDIEVEMKWDELKQSLQDSIGSQLGQDCKKYKIQKVQIQYAGDPSVLLTKLKTGKNADGYTVRYEAVVKCCNKKNVALYEYLFNDKGEKISISQIVFKNSSNLEY